MKEVTFKVEYDGFSMDVRNAVTSCSKALKDAGVPFVFEVGNNEHDGFEMVTLKSTSTDPVVEPGISKQKFERIRRQIRDLLTPPLALADMVLIEPTYSGIPECATRSKECIAAILKELEVEG
jgi:hypothetical protein